MPLRFTQPLSFPRSPLSSPHLFLALDPDQPDLGFSSRTYLAHLAIWSCFGTHSQEVMLYSIQYIVQFQSIFRLILIVDLGDYVHLVIQF